MPLQAGRSKKVVRENTKEMIEAGYPPKQAYAAAMRKAGHRKGRKKTK